MRYYNLGLNVCLVYGLPYSYRPPNEGYNLTKETIEAFKKEICSQKFKYLIALTANIIQFSFRDSLKEIGFRDVVTFKSSHGGGETVTLWTKTNENFDAELEKIPFDDYPYNCSVAFNDHDSYKNCKIIVEPKERWAGLKEDKWKRIKNSPILFKILDANLAEYKEIA